MLWVLTQKEEREEYFLSTGALKLSYMLLKASLVPISSK